MLACVLLRPCPYHFIIENVQNVLISALAYVEYHIPRIKSDDELRLYSNIMKRPGEKWNLTGHLHYRLQQLCMSCLQNHGKQQPPQREALLTLGLWQRSPWGKRKLKHCLYFSICSAHSKRMDDHCAAWICNQPAKLGCHHMGKYEWWLVLVQR